MRKILISAGDPSGDQLLARIVSNIRKTHKDKIEFIGMAGPLTKMAGANVIVDNADLAVVGVSEVLKVIPQIKNALTKLSDELPRVDSVICVDYPTFNFILAKKAKRKNIPVDYIVAPQVWAWKQGRIHEMKKFIRRLYPAFPFEQEMFREAGIDTQFLGHPIRDVLPPKNKKKARDSFSLNEDDFVFAVLPGSRSGEIAKQLPVMIDAWQEMRSREFSLKDKKNIVALLGLSKRMTLEKLYGALSKKQAEFLKQMIDSGEWKVGQDSHTVMMAADFGWITSGTATLEAAYYLLPHVICYKLNKISELILGQLSSYFREPDAPAGLPNIMLEKIVLPELLQSNLTPIRLAMESIELLEDPVKFRYIQSELRWIPKKLGHAGAAERISQDLLDLWRVNESD